MPWTRGARGAAPSVPLKLAKVVRVCAGEAMLIVAQKRRAKTAKANEWRAVCMRLSPKGASLSDINSECKELVIGDDSRLHHRARAAAVMRLTTVSLRIVKV